MNKGVLYALKYIVVEHKNTIKMTNVLFFDE